MSSWRYGSKEPPEYTSFFFKLLKTLRMLKGAGTSKFKAMEIAEAMEKQGMEGDVLSQVENALSVAVVTRFVNVDSRKRYSLAVPAATLQQVPSECLLSENERLEEVFYTKETSSACPKKRKTACNCEDQFESEKNSMQTASENFYALRSRKPTKGNCPKKRKPKREAEESSSNSEAAAAEDCVKEIEEDYKK